MSAPPQQPSGSSADRNNAANYLLRTAQQSNIQLSAMADQKASIVLGATFVMATVASGDLIANNDPSPALIVLAVASLVSGIFAILTLIPKVSAPPDGAAVNPLFFGHVARLSPEEFRGRMVDVLADAESAQRAIVDDLHQASSVLLGSKYRWLRFSYLSLLAGMIATAATAVLT